MHRLLALVCVLVVVCETGCCGARRHYSNCVPDACGGCGCGDPCSPGYGGGHRHRHRRAPLFGRGGSFWGGDCCDAGCDSGCGCGVPMEGMTYPGGCSCGQGHVMEGTTLNTTNSLVPAAPGAIPQQVYSPPIGAPPPAPPMEPAPAPAPPPPAPLPAGKIETMSAEYFHPQATLVPPGASPTSLQAPPLMQMPQMQMPEMPAAPPLTPPPLQVQAQGAIVPASSVESAPGAMPVAPPASAPPLLWVPSGVQQ